MSAATVHLSGVTTPTSCQQADLNTGVGRSKPRMNPPRSESEGRPELLLDCIAMLAAAAAAAAGLAVRQPPVPVGAEPCRG